MADLGHDIRDASGGDRTKPDISVAVRTLLGGGFELDGVERNPGYALVLATRTDEFGSEHGYAFAIAEDGLTDTQVAAARITADYHASNLVLVGGRSADVPSLEWDRFVNLFGGPVFSATPLEPGFAAQLEQLSRNSLPRELVGRPDDLFEEYTRVGLEFIFGGRVHRYGQGRRFERRPDGIVLSPSGFRALYDVKAYKDGYPVSAESSRQFQSYVDDFARRYSAFVPRLHSFIVVSSEFVQQGGALDDRSRELLSKSGVPLSFLRARTLAEIVDALARAPAARHSIDWPRVFSDPVVDTERVKREIAAVRRDGIVAAV